MKFLLMLLLTFSSLATASTSILVNQNDRQLVQENVNEVRPLASITKLMTAMVVLDSNIDLEKKTPLINKWSTILPKRMYSRLDLLTAMLVKSDNSAAESLAIDYPGGREAFMKEMNNKAKQLDMHNTSFLDPTGLSIFNVSTASDIQKMLVAAKSYPMIRQITTLKEAKISNKDRKQVQQIAFSNTNHTVLTNFENIVVTKTGLTNLAGWCVGLAVEENGQDYYIVILGSKSKQSRLDKVKELMYNYVIRN